MMLEIHKAYGKRGGVGRLHPSRPLAFTTPRKAYVRGLKELLFPFYPRGEHASPSFQ